MTKPRALATALALGLSVASMSTFAEVQKFSYSTGNILETSNGFSKTITRYVGKNWELVNVQLNGFEFDFVSNDHHISRIKMFIQDKSYNASTGYVSFKINGLYTDKYGDDYYTWDTRYTLVAMR